MGKKPNYPPNLVYLPAPQTHHIYLPAITSCSPFLVHHCKIPPSVFFIKVLSSCEQAVLCLGSEGNITVLSPPAVRSQVINPDYLRPGFCLCFNNSMAHLLPLCWEHQYILPHWKISPDCPCNALPGAGCMGFLSPV